MTYGVQKIAKALGESGCYFLSLCKIAEVIAGVFFDPIHEAAEAIEAGTMGPDCFIKDAGAVVSALTRERYIVFKAGPGHALPLYYVLAPGEREILRYERPNPAGGEPLAHFIVGDGIGRPSWDPWPESLAVSEGRLVSRRIIRRAS